MDQLSDGRLEVGIGAGHAFTEYAAIGQAFDPPAVRKARLAETVEILPRLLRGEEVTFDGEHYHLKRARTLRAQQDHVPFLVGVNGRSALAHAARHADIFPQRPPPASRATARPLPRACARHPLLDAHSDLAKTASYVTGCWSRRSGDEARR